MSTHACDAPRKGLHLPQRGRQGGGRENLEDGYCFHLECLCCLHVLNKDMSILCIAHIIKIISKKKSQRKETTLNYPSTFPTAFKIHTPCQLGRAFRVPGSDPRRLTPGRHNSLQLLHTPAFSIPGPHTHCPPSLSPPPPWGLNPTPKGVPRLCWAG